MARRRTFPNLIIIKHPLIQKKLTILRDHRTPNRDFRQILSELSALMVYEMTKRHQTVPVRVKTPLGRTVAGVKLKRSIALIPVLRAGLGMLEGVHRLIPDAGVGHLGIYRDETNLRPVEYFFKVPSNIKTSEAIIMDPMLATGGTAALAVTLLKKAGAARVVFLSLLAAPEGCELFFNEHPDTPVFTAALDESLNARGYILPGLGDAGDRLYGTEAS